MLPALTLLSLFPLAAANTSPPLKPGSYIRQGGQGSLELTLDKSGKLAFDIETTGGNAHTCELSGAVMGHEGKTGSDDGPACTVRFDVDASGNLTLTSVTDDACRAFCGARADFDGKYFLPAPACETKAVTATQSKFKKLYDQKKLADAIQVLEPVLKQCEQVIDRFQVIGIRNDLAITHHKLKDDAGCLQVLAPLRTWAQDTDPGAEPAFEDILKPLVKATRFNFKTCGQPLSPSAP